MSVTSWLRNRKARSVRRPAFRPRLEVLEGRSLPSFGWATAVGDTAPPATSVGIAVAADATGNVYTTGYYATDLTPAGFGVQLNSAGNNDIYVAKYSRSGVFLWTVSLGGAANDKGNGITVDGAGTNVYVAGQYAGGYVAQLNAATGAVNWSRAVTGTSADAVAVDGSGSAYVTSHAIAGGSYRSYLTKLDTGGAQIWQDTITTVAGLISAPSVAVAGNSVYVGGTDYGSTAVTVGSTTSSWTPTSEGGYVLKVSGDNVFGWVQRFEGNRSNYNVQANHVAADSAGNVYAYGSFMGSLNFPGTTGLTGPTKGGLSAFVAKLTPTGSAVWAKKFGTFNDLTQTSIAADGAGAVYRTGSFSGTTGFNPAGGGNLTSAGSNDVYVVKLDANGAFQWAVGAGTAGYDSGYGICVDAYGDVDVAGVIAAGTAAFGDPTHTLTTGTTAFLWQITQP
jgi:hypothetical protein